MSAPSPLKASSLQSSGLINTVGFNTTSLHKDYSKNLSLLEHTLSILWKKLSEESSRSSKNFIESQKRKFNKENLDLFEKLKKNDLTKQSASVQQVIIKIDRLICTVSTDWKWLFHAATANCYLKQSKYDVAIIYLQKYQNNTQRDATVDLLTTNIRWELFIKNNKFIESSNFLIERKAQAITEENEALIQEIIKKDVLLTSHLKQNVLINFPKVDLKIINYVINKALKNINDIHEFLDFFYEKKAYLFWKRTLDKISLEEWRWTDIPKYINIYFNFECCRDIKALDLVRYRPSELKPAIDKAPRSEQIELWKLIYHHSNHHECVKILAEFEIPQYMYEWCLELKSTQLSNALKLAEKVLTLTPNNTTLFKDVTDLQKILTLELGISNHDPESYYELGLLILDGLNKINKDPHLGMVYIKKAAELGHKVAYNFCAFRLLFDQQSLLIYPIHNFEQTIAPIINYFSYADSLGLLDATNKQLLNLLVPLNPDTINQHNEDALSEIYYQIGRCFEASGVINFYLEPAIAVGWYRQAALLGHLKSLKRCLHRLTVQELTIALTKLKDTPNNNYYRGYIYEGIELYCPNAPSNIITFMDLEKAYENYLKAFLAGYCENFERTGVFFFKRSNPQVGLECFSQISSFSTIEAFFYYGESMFRGVLVEKNIEEAEKALLKASRYMVDARLVLGELYIEKNDSNRAIIMYESALPNEKAEIKLKEIQSNLLYDNSI